MTPSPKAAAVKRSEPADAGAAAESSKKPRVDLIPKKSNQGAFEVFDGDAQLGGPLDPFMSVTQLQLALDTASLMANVWATVLAGTDDTFRTRGPAVIGSAEKGWTAPWNIPLAMLSLASPGKYMASVNFFWLDLHGVAGHHTCLCWRGILNAMQFFFAEPCDCPHLLATTEDTGPLQAAFRLPGSLVPRGNAEVICGLGVALARAIKRGTLSEWLPYLLKIPCTVHHSIGTSTNIMLKVRGSQEIALKNENCKLTALQESLEFHELEIELVKQGVRNTQSAMAEHLGKTSPWCDVNTSWSSARVLGGLRLIYTNLVMNTDAFRLLSEIQVLWGNECLVGGVWNLVELCPHGISAAEIVFTLQSLKIMFKRNVISDPRKVSKLNLKGRSDRGDIGLVELCRVRYALNVWADVQYGKSVRPEIFEKLVDPDRFDLHSPCEKELQLDRCHSVDSIATLKKLDISCVEKTFIDFKCELHGSMFRVARMVPL